jgi:hypothetical protein
VRSANRNRNTPTNRNNNAGFRLASPPVLQNCGVHECRGRDSRVIMSRLPGLAGRGAPNSFAREGGFPGGGENALHCGAKTLPPHALPGTFPIPSCPGRRRPALETAMIEVASLRYGVIFKKAFSRPNIFKAFVKDFLGLDLEIDQVETEKSFSPPIGAVDSRFDLFAEDKKNRIIVDIQHARLGDHYDRFLHYHCAALLEQIANAQNYRPSRGVFTIVILTSGDEQHTDLAMIEFDPKSRSGKPLGKIPHKVLYVCPKYVTEDTPEPYREWLRAIQDSL